MANLNSLLSRLKLEHPIFLAPMAGGPSTPALAAAVSNAGGLGSLGLAYTSPEKIKEEIRKVRALTSKPVAINLFMAPFAPMPADSDIERMQAILGVYRKEVGLSGIATIPSRFENVEEQMQALIDERVDAFTFTFGAPSPEWVRRFREKGIFVMGTATTLEEGIFLEQLGVDAVCAQGSEAGGHRGTFIGKMSDAMVGILPLTAQLVDRLSVPVIAAGGIMNGRGIAAALALGAQAVQMGTAFLLCPEAGTSKPYRKVLKDANRSRFTEITRVFSGREARGIVNRFLSEMKDVELLPYPYQNAVTRELRTVSAQQENAEFLSLWAGQGATLIRERPASDLMQTLVRELKA